MKFILTCVSVFLFSTNVFAVQNIDCSSALSQPAQAWINNTSSAQGGSTIAIVSAVSDYAKCVDKDIQSLKQKLKKSGNYPLMGGNGNFQDFSETLENFTRLALKTTTTGGTWDNIQTAYTRLYQKQFNFIFFAQYLKNFDDPIINRILNSKRPDLKKAKSYFEKSIARFPQEQQALNKSFNQLLISAQQAGIKPEFIYYYAISIVQPVSDQQFAEPAF